ncbi:MAG: rhamnulokinase [Chthoniobacterales bacterium]|nr:rhamnulokinase [Chthoniobacterales bacterium]
MKKRVYLAADLGADSGRVMAGIFDGRKIMLEEMARFPTGGMLLPDGWHWDLLRIYADIRKGIAKAVAAHGNDVVSVSVDTWGVDYGLLDAGGRLLGMPWMYRDSRTDGAMEAVDALVNADELYRRTGIQPMFFNSIYQLFAETRQHPAAVKAATRLAFVPDLLTYWLGGEQTVERTIASTSGLLKAGAAEWDKELAEKLGIPAALLPPVSEPCTIAGNLRGDDGKPGKIKVVLCGSHDTASAVAGVPARGKNPLFISSGTWSLIGRELPDPIVTAATCAARFSNEQGLGGTTRFLKNVAGMWLLQECKRNWERGGEKLEYESIVAKAAGTKTDGFIDPDAPEFSRPCDMPAAIAAWLSKSGQNAPGSRAETTRIIFESLALKYRLLLRTMKQWMPDFPDTLHIVGGGSRNALLNQMTADAGGLRVLAGPSEATALGNVVAQMIACGDLASLDDGRDLIGRSFEIGEFTPRDTALWDDKAAKFDKVLSAS